MTTEQKALCIGCRVEVKDHHPNAIQCDPKPPFNEPNHWWHKRCLVQNHLLEGKGVPLSDKLIKKLKDKTFSYRCLVCAPEEPPLPVQLYMQKIISFDDLMLYNAFTPEVKTYLMAKGYITEHDKEIPGVLDPLQLQRPGASGTSGGDKAAEQEVPPPGTSTIHLEHEHVEQSEVPNKVAIEELVEHDSDHGSEHNTPPLSPTPSNPEAGGGPKFGWPGEVPAITGKRAMHNVTGPQTNTRGGDTRERDERGFLVPSLGQQNPAPLLVPQQPNLGTSQLAQFQGLGGVAPTGSNPMDFMMAFMSQMAKESDERRQDDRRREERLERERREDRDRYEQQRQADREMFQSLLTQSRTSPPLNPSTTPSSSQASTPSGFTKPPKIEVESFGGNILNWPSFWDQFSEIIGNKPNLSDVEKLSYLFSKLRGPAKEAVQNYKLEAANYPLVVEELKDRYDDKEKIKMAYLKQLLNLSPVTSSGAPLQKLSDSVSSIARVLLPLVDNNVDVLDMQCITTVPHLFEKLPVIIRSQMLQSAGKTVSTHLSVFRETLKKQVKFQEMLGITSTGPPSPPGPGSGGYTGGGRGNRPPRGGGSTGAGLLGSGPPPKKHPTGSGPQKPKREVYCHFCRVTNQHKSFQCSEYSTLESRKQRLGKVCYVCLREGHYSPDCPTKGKFKCLNCDSIEHNGCLCPNLFKPNKNKNPGANKKDSSAPTDSELAGLGSEGAVSSSEESGEHDVAMQTIVTKVRNPKTLEEFSAQIIYDCGSKHTYIDSKIARPMGLHSRARFKRTVSTFNCTTPRKLWAGISEIDIMGSDGNYIRLTGNIIDKITTPVFMEGFSMSKKDEKTVNRLKMADDQSHVDRTFDIDILIGDDYYPMLLKSGKVQLKKSGVYLLETSLGWVTSGLINDNARLEHVRDSSLAANLSLLVDSSSKPVVLEEDTNSLLEELWKFETLGIKDPKECDVNDHIALKQFKDTVKFEDGRVSVQWLTKDGIENLNSNFLLALARLKSLLKVLGKNPEVREKYTQTIGDQKTKIIIEIVDEEKNKKSKKFQKHYVPHHAVITPQKKTTKMRMVFDASMIDPKTGKSLNDYLFRGPNLLPDVGGLLIRFRVKAIGVISDIEKALLQLALQECARDLTRFLWLKDPEKLTTENNLEVYRFCRVPFGFKTSPFFLAAGVCVLLDKAPESEKDIAEKIRDNIYVDNVILTMDTVEEAQRFYKSAKSIFTAGSMNLREWNSNSSAVMDSIPEKDRDTQSEVKVLGLMWDTSADTLSISMKSMDTFKTAKTKREVLSCVASIFDPLGLVSCLKVQGMIFLQEIWREKVDWDDSLSTVILDKWLSLCDVFEIIPQLKIPRVSCKITKNSKLSLACFTDASAEAFTTTIYLHCETPGAETEVSLIFAKARLCPVSGLSVPKSELMGVVIGTRCLKYLQKELHLKIEDVYVWTDSLCVLGWIKNESHDQGVFVTNRVMEICKNLDVTFLYIPTHLNPADLASKSREVTYKMPWSLWWHGPEFLKLPKKDWPDFLPITSTSSPTLVGGGSNQNSKTSNSRNSTENLDLEAIFDVKGARSFMHLVRVSAYVQRFVRNLRKSVQAKKDQGSSHSMQTRSKSQKGVKAVGEISEVPLLDKKELVSAQKLWLQSTQRKAFPELFTDKIHTSNFAQNLSLKLDDDWVLRSQGRFGDSDLPGSAKYPALLPAHSDVTHLIVDSFHRHFLHSGVNYTLAHLRSEFWIPKGRKVIATVLKNCLHCRKFHAKPFAHPKMPNLPKERVSQAVPFTFTGIDFMGPFYYKSDEGEKKAWVLLLTCFTVRAVHLEVVVDMTAESLLCALRRFVARRGKPATIFSDNAKQFKLMDKILKKTENMDLVRNYLKSEGILWKFIPELTPWAGGGYERLVGVAKGSLKKSLGRTKLNFEQLRTLLTEVEDVMNSRPITFVNMNKSDDDMMILTPQHFLSTGRNLRLPVLPEDDPVDPDFIPKLNTGTKVIQAWKKGQHHLNRFWEIWQKQYLLNLRERHTSDKFPKVKSEVFRCPEVGEVVLIKDHNLPRSLWKLGKIIDLHVGRDKLVRSVGVKTSGSRQVITRPVSLVFPLEIQSFDETESDQSTESDLFACDPGLMISEPSVNLPKTASDGACGPSVEKSMGPVEKVVELIPRFVPTTSVREVPYELEKSEAPLKLGETRDWLRSLKKCGQCSYFFGLIIVFLILFVSPSKGLALSKGSLRPFLDAQNGTVRHLNGGRPYFRFQMSSDHPEDIIDQQPGQEEVMEEEEDTLTQKIHKDRRGKGFPERKHKKKRGSKGRQPLHPFTRNFRLKDGLWHKRCTACRKVHSPDIQQCGCKAAQGGTGKRGGHHQFSNDRGGRGTGRRSYGERYNGSGERFNGSGGRYNGSGGRYNGSGGRYNGSGDRFHGSGGRFDGNGFNRNQHGGRGWNRPYGNRGAFGNGGFRGNGYRGGYGYGYGDGASQGRGASTPHATPYTININVGVPQGGH